VDDVQLFEPRRFQCQSANVPVAANSSGEAARIDHRTLEIHVNDFGLHATSCPAGKFGIFFYGPDPAEVPFGNGYLCVAGGLVRLPLVKTDASGQASRAIDFENMPAGGEITAGETRRFQFWFRDPAAGGSYFDLSDAIEVTFVLDHQLTTSTALTTIGVKGGRLATRLNAVSYDQIRSGAV
jgi:hypothetical protein